MAKRMAELYQGPDNKTTLSVSRGKVEENIRITQNVAAMLTGHGKIRVYLHRFKIGENAHCVCLQGDQLIDHLLYECNLLETQRGILRKNVTKNGQWPADKHELITNHLDCLLNYIE
jgi:hypothetical protein